MSVNRLVFRVAALCGLASLAWPAAAADEEPPDLEFLEYLGSWEESDEDWLIFTEMMPEKAAREEQEQETETTGKDEPAKQESTE